jgi:hypothetical protein
VPDDQLSLAIGRAGQNARLAAKLTGWRIDIQGVTEAITWALRQVNEDSDVLPALGPVAELLPDVAGTLRQHEQEGMPYNSEELLKMRQVIERVGGYYASIRDAERARLVAEEAARRAAIEAAEAERRTAIEAARARIPSRAYEVPLSEMDLSTRVLGHLERAELATVGEVMEHLAEGDEGLLKLNGIGPKSLAEVKECIEALALLEAEEAVPTEGEVAAEAGEAPLPAEQAPEAEAPEAVEEAQVAEAVTVEEAPVAVAEEAAVPSEVAPEAAEGAPVEEGVAEEVPVVVEAPEPYLEEGETEAELEEERKRERRLRRELVYDEELGEVVARRRRKRDEGLEEWDEFLG